LLRPIGRWLGYTVFAFAVSHACRSARRAYLEARSASGDPDAFHVRLPRGNAAMQKAKIPDSRAEPLQI